MRGEFDSIPRSWEVAAELRGVAKRRREAHAQAIQDARAVRNDRRWGIATLIVVAGVLVAEGFSAYTKYQEIDVAQNRGISLSPHSMKIICLPHPCNSGRVGEWFDPRIDDGLDQWFTGAGGPYRTRDLMGRRL